MEIQIIGTLLAWVANFCFLYGAWALGKKHLSGWVAQILPNLFYAIQSIIINNIPLLTVSIVLIGVNIYGFYSWTKKPKKMHESSIKNHAEHSYLTEMLKHYED
jgi:nicotinamide riboside transporter PnuC